MTSKQFPIQIQNKTINVQVFVKDSVEWVAIKPICEAIGVAEQKQCQKLSTNPQFNYNLMVAVGADGKSREMACLPLEEVAMWLCGINANRTKPEIRDILIAFQKRCQMELYAALNGGAGTAVVARLQKTIEFLTETCARLEATVIRQGELLSSQGQHIEMLSQSQASMAGVALSQQKKTRHLRLAH